MSEWEDVIPVVVGFALLSLACAWLCIRAEVKLRVREEDQRIKQAKDMQERRDLYPDCAVCGSVWFLCRYYNSDACGLCKRHRADHSDRQSRLCAAEMLARAKVQNFDALMGEEDHDRT